MSLVIRPYTEADYPALLQIQRECFPPPYPEEQLWSLEQIRSHVEHFPEGALCAVLEGKLVGSCTSLIIQWNPGEAAHSWGEATDWGFIRTHNPRGNTLYGVDIAVRPAYRGRGIARALYQARYELVRRLGLERFLAGGRMPGYHRYRNHLTPEQYAQEVISGRILDPVITPQLKAGLKPLRVVRDYLPDQESGNCALLLEWRNPERA